MGRRLQKERDLYDQFQTITTSKKVIRVTH